MKTKSKKQDPTIKISTETHDKIKSAALMEGRKMRYIVERAMNCYLTLNQKERGW